MLGKLFWVARVVKYARPFMGRLLDQLRSLSKVHDGKKVKFLEESKKDVKWWAEYLEHFNGVTMIVNEDPIPLTYEQLLDSPYNMKFFPVVRNIGSKENAIADHISRYFDEDAAAEVFARFDLKNMKLIKPKTTYYTLSSNW